MKKIVLFFLPFLFIISSCSEKESSSSEQIYSDLSRNNVKGKVASIQELIYDCDAKGATTNLRQCCITTSEFDSAGLLKNRKFTDNKGNVVGTEATESYPNGLTKSMISYQEGKPLQKITYELNDKGLYSKMEIVGPEGNLAMYAPDLVQNEFGQLTSYSLYGPDSVLLQKQEYKYDGNRLIESVTTDGTGKVVSRYQAKYNDKGEGIEETVTEYSQGQESATKRTLTYDERDISGNWTKLTAWDADGKAMMVTVRQFVYRN